MDHHFRFRLHLLLPLVVMAQPSRILGLGFSFLSFHLVHFSLAFHFHHLIRLFLKEHLRVHLHPCTTQPTKTNALKCYILLNIFSGNRIWFIHITSLDLSLSMTYLFNILAGTSTCFYKSLFYLCSITAQEVERIRPKIS